MDDAELNGDDRIVVPASDELLPDKDAPHIRYNMLHYDHSDNWFRGHSVHLNNLNYNKMDTFSDRNASGRLDSRCS